MTIWTLRATIGQEKAIAKHINKKIETKMKDINLYSLLIPESLRGYIFIEADSIDKIDQAIMGIPHIRNKIVGIVEIKEIEGFLVPKPTIEGLRVNDIIEIISGPFKGSRAKINRIDISREEVTVELLDSQIPIPIKLHSDFCKIIESAATGDEVNADEFESVLTPGERAAKEKEGEKESGKKKKEEKKGDEDIFSEFFKTS